MEQLIPSLIQEWGPLGLIIGFGWYALKWLATRDDVRNSQLINIIREVNTTVANNTEAARQTAKTMEQMGQVLARVERDVNLVLARHKGNQRR